MLLTSYFPAIVVQAAVTEVNKCDETRKTMKEKIVKKKEYNVKNFLLILVTNQIFGNKIIILVSNYLNY